MKLFLTFSVAFYLLPGFHYFNNRTQGGESLVFENKVYKKGIETVLAYKKGVDMSFPIIELGSSEQIVFSFDELGTSVNDYSWSLVHCNANWEKSDLDPIEYIDGYQEGNVDDYAFSQNTMVNYINYQIEYPTDDSRLTVSGNYILKVYKRGEPDNLILTQRFYVVETLTELSVSIDQLNVNIKEGRNQRINIQVECQSDIENPAETVHLKVIKDDGFEKDFSLLRPTFVNGELIKYQMIEELAFAGGNEYRHFDIKSLKFISDRIFNIDKQLDAYHVYLRDDEEQAFLAYNFKNDLNGRKLIKLESNDKSHIMADYCYVHFTLDTEIPLQNGDFYIYGALTDWGYKQSTKMNYDFKTKKFLATLLLKQGYYNYLYHFVTNDKMFNNEEGKLLIEGNHFQAENEYQVLIYYKDYSTSYEKLVGYTKVNSTRSANY